MKLFSSSLFADVEIDASSSGDVSIENVIGDSLYINSKGDSLISSISVNGIDCNFNGSVSGLKSIDISACLENVAGVAEIVVVTGDKVIESNQFIDGFDRVSLLSCTTNTAEGFFNGSGSLIDPFIICDCNQLQNMENYLSGNFEINSNIDCGVSSGWNSGFGFKPIGSKIVPFTGEFNGNEFNVSNLYINNDNSDLGLFGVLHSGSISNLNVKDLNILSTEKYKTDQITNILVIDNILYALSLTGDKVLTYDVSNIYNFIFLDEYENVSAIDNADSLFFLDDILYVGSQNDMFATFNVSNPSNIILLDSDTSSVYLDVADFVFVDSNKIAYVANKEGDSISTFNVSDPTNIVFLDEYSNTAYLEGVGYIRKVNDVIFAASRFADSISSYDVSDPTNIVFLDEYPSIAYLDGVISFDILNDVLFTVSSSSNSITSFNISNPSNIVFLDEFESSTYLDSASYIIINQEVAYITSYLNSYIDIVKINISNPLDLVFLEKFDIIGNDGNFGPSQISIFNDVLFSNIDGSALNFATFDISNPIDTIFLSYDSYGGNIGGLAGYITNSSISNSSATGVVDGSYYVGGLIGRSYTGSKILNSYANVEVIGNSSVGGLVGYLYYAEIQNSYADSVVSGDGYVGGLVGSSYYSVILNSYSVSNVSGGAPIGGLVGYVGGTLTITNSYWDTETSGQGASAAGAPQTTSALQTPTSNAGIYSGWSSVIWDFGTVSDYPFLK